MYCTGEGKINSLINRETGALNPPCLFRNSLPNILFSVTEPLESRGGPREEGDICRWKIKTGEEAEAEKNLERWDAADARPWNYY